MRDFAFAESTPKMVPRHQRPTFVIAVVVHTLVLAMLIQIKTQPVRMTSAGSEHGSITGYVAAPAAAAAAAAPKPREAKTALETETAKPAQEAQSTAGSAVAADLCLSG